MLGLYVDIEFPNLGGRLPYVICNMISTIDGKILSGNRDENVMDLGTAFDHQTMRNLESKCDGVLIGAQTLRATKGLWYSDKLVRVVLTKSGRLPMQSRFFTDCPEKAVIASYSAKPEGLDPNIHFLELEEGSHLTELLVVLKEKVGVNRLMIEGGSEVNAAFLRESLIDELFLTISPKVKLGSEVPTIAGGSPLERGKLIQFHLASCQAVGDEVFLRYKRGALEE